MKLDARQAFALVAVFAAGWYIARRGAVAAAASPAAHNTVAASPDWWTYAGSWAV